MPQWGKIAAATLQLGVGERSEEKDQSWCCRGQKVEEEICLDSFLPSFLLPIFTRLPLFIVVVVIG